MMFPGALHTMEAWIKTGSNSSFIVIVSATTDDDKLWTLTNLIVHNVTFAIPTIDSNDTFYFAYGFILITSNSSLPFYAGLLIDEPVYTGCGGWDFDMDGCGRGWVNSVRRYGNAGFLVLTSTCCL